MKKKLFVEMLIANLFLLCGVVVSYLDGMSGSNSVLEFVVCSFGSLLMWNVILYLLLVKFDEGGGSSECK